jgi:phenylpropionate dioxygenase-like ring-hydroxylating dioxygenase large terminal subunit
MNIETRIRSTQVTEDPSRSFSLPGWAYLDPDILALEKREIFYKNWQYAGWVGDVKNSGEYITAELIDQSVIIIRGDDGTLRGFHNVCQHRGHQLLTGCGKVGAISCPYHAWAYRLDGALRNARGAERTAGFDMGVFSLKPIRVEVLADKLVFFNLDMDAKPLGDQVGDLVEDIRRDIPAFDQLVKVQKRPPPPEPGMAMFPVEANWKIVMDNFLECYHCRNAHPGFSQDLVMDSYRTTAHGLWSKQRGDTRREDGGEVMFWSLFPNLTCSTATGGKPRFNISIFAVPDGPARTQYGHSDSYRLPGDEEGVDFKPDWGPLGVEDKDICESVHKGLASLGYEQGRFIYDFEHGETSEEAVHLFHRLVVEALGI